MTLIVGYTALCIMVKLILSQDGVYKAGCASKQEGYHTAVYNVFEGLNKIEKILAGKDYLVGGKLTEADIRLFVTIVSDWG